MFFIGRPKQPVLFVILLLAVTFTVLSPCLQSGFLADWDDGSYLLENPRVRSLSSENIADIFQSTVLDTYVPLTVLSFAVEYHFFDYDPFVYHLNNLLLHLAVTLGVFLLAQRLGFPFWAAWAGALLFGIHPLRVESVAWVTERKDVLYAFFYVAALNFYWEYLRSEKKLFFGITVGLGLLSLLAKPMALSLPLILLLLDWYAERPLRLQVVGEKCVFFIYIIPLTWLTYSGFMRNPICNPDEALLSWVWTFMFYIRQFFMPIILTPDYSIPRPVSLAHVQYSASILALLILLGLVWRFRSRRELVFAILFYLFSIFFLLRFDLGKDYCFVADRFMYLPSLGLCLWLGSGIYHGVFNWSARIGVRFSVLLIIIIIFTALGLKTYRQAWLWNSELTLWNHVLRHNPRSSAGLINRGCFFSAQGKRKAALRDFKKATEMYPHMAKAWYNLGNIHKENGRWRKALRCYNKVLDIEPDYIKVYNNRAIVYDRMGLFHLAINDFSTVIKLNPDNIKAYYNRGLFYRERGMENQAQADFQHARQMRYVMP